MIERARWRPTDAPRTPLGVLYGRETLLGLPVGLWVAAYTTALALVALLLPKDLGGPVFTVLLLPLMRTDRKDYDVPVRRSALPPPKSRRERLFRLLVVPLEEESALVPLEPRPSPGPCFYVETSLHRGSHKTGGDLGVVAFSEGWLVYEGRNTAFAISPRDVVRATREKAGWALQLPEGQTLCLAMAANAEWEAEMRRWLDGPPPAGLSRLPPLEPNEVRRLRLAGRLHAGACMVAGSSSAGLLLNLLRDKPSTGQLFGAWGFALALFAAGLAAAWISSGRRAQTG